MNSYYVIDQDGVLIMEVGENEEMIIKNKETKLKQREYLKSRSDKNKFVNRSHNKDNFCFLYYNQEKPLFENENISKANISRLIYLATFIDYDSNRLVHPERLGRKLPFTLNDIKNKMKLSKRVFNEFKNELLNAEILYIEDDGFYISKEYFCKGEVNKNIGKNYIRMYINTIRALYINCVDSKEHKSLSTIFQLIPYLDIETNILCFNPNKNEELKVLTLKDISKILNYSDGGLKKFEENLMKFQITKTYDSGEIYDYHLIYRVSLHSYGINSECYIINPLCFYGGTNDNVFKELMLLLQAF